MDQRAAKALLARLVVFATVGGFFNIVFVGLFLGLRVGLSAQWAIGLALVL